MMIRMRREMSGSASEPPIMPQIDNLLIIDRNVDPLTPLLTQLTYEGLIDEFFGIHNSQYCFHYSCYHFVIYYIRLLSNIALVL